MGDKDNFMGPRACADPGCVPHAGWDDSTGKLNRPFGWWTPSFLLDYVGFIALGLCVLNSSDVFDLDTDYQVFTMSDPSVQKPLAADQVSIEDVTLMAFIPSFIIYVFFIVKRRDWFEDAHAVVVTLLAGLFVSNFVFLTTKSAVRRPRPDLVMRCAPACQENVTWACVPVADYSVPELCDDPACCTVMCDILDARYIPGSIVPCTNMRGSESVADQNLDTLCAPLWDRTITTAQADCKGSFGTGAYSPYSIAEGFNSFPSGHVINILGVYTFNWLYLAGKFQVYGRGVTQRMYVFGYALMVAGIFVALYVGLSRISDNKHNVSDIIAGALIGLLPMLFAYPLYWQSFGTGGNPLRRPKTSCLDVLGLIYCRDASLQQPWPLHGGFHLPGAGQPPAALRVEAVAANGSGAGAGAGAEAEADAEAPGATTSAVEDTSAGVNGSSSLQTKSMEPGDSSSDASADATAAATAAPVVAEEPVRVTVSQV